MRSVDTAVGGRRVGRTRRWLLAALLVWSATGLARAVGKEGASWANRGDYVAGPSWWRLGAPQPERLERCLHTLLPVVPAGSPVVVGDAAGDLQHWRWAAYLLPERDVLPSAEAAPVAVEYFLAAGPVTPAGERIRGGRWCAAYRLP